MQDKVVIRQDKPKLIMSVVFVTLGVVLIIGLLIVEWEKAGPGGFLLSIFVGAVFLAGLIYLLKELLERKIEMAISHEGIYLRKKGLYPWHLIECFSTQEDEGTVMLILHFEKYAEEDFQISGLEYDKKEIIEMMLAYKGSSNVYYAGHKKK